MAEEIIHRDADKIWVQQSIRLGDHEFGSMEVSAGISSAEDDTTYEDLVNTTTAQLMKVFKPLLVERAKMIEELNKQGGRR